ncbi:MAG: tetratricopeptide repeat protein, partial [Planctomycetota bacterium]
MTAFTTMLAVFLFGIGAGGAVGARLARTGQRLVEKLQTTVAATALLFSLGALLVYELPLFYLGSYASLGQSFAGGLVVRFALSALVLLPGALGLGAAFPLCVHLAAGRHSGGGTGRAYAAHAAAGIAGSTLAVMLFVPLLGPQTTVAAVAAAVAAACALPARRPAVWALAAGAALGLVPPSGPARERLHAGVYFMPHTFLVDGKIHRETWDDGVDIPFTRYGREATVSILRWYGKPGLLIDGKAVATEQGVQDTHHLSLLGHLPMALHRNPQRVLVVGLGMGITWRAVALHRPRELRVVEIEPAVVEAARRIGIEPPSVVAADARTWLQATGELYDVITSDPIHPWVRGGGDLYTREYLLSCRDKLTPGGVVCQWLPVYQMATADVRTIIRTFCSVFTGAAYYGGGDLVLVGVTAGRVPEPRRLEGAAARALRELGADDLALLRVAAHAALVAAAGAGPLLDDDGLRLEFSAPRHLEQPQLARSFAWIRKLWGRPPKPYDAMLRAQEAIAGGAARAAGRGLGRARAQAPENGFVRRYTGELDLVDAEAAIRYGNLESAAASLERARRLLPGDPRLVGTEADLRAAQGDREEAARLYEQLLERRPDSVYLQRRLRRVRER